MHEAHGNRKILEISLEYKDKGYCLLKDIGL